MRLPKVASSWFIDIINTFGSKTYKGIGGWTKFHNDEMRDFDYSSDTVFLGDQSRGERQGGDMENTGDKRNAYIVLVV
jgi:hypothetical protein